MNGVVSLVGIESRNGESTRNNRDDVVITTVSNTNTLLSAISSAHDGDTILLSAGEYSNLNIKNVHFANGVTIAAADASHPAVIEGINLQNSAGLNFQGLEVTVDPRIGVAFNLMGDSNITMNGLSIHQSATGGTGGMGISLRNSSNVTVENTDIHNVGVGIQHLDDDHIQILNNSIHDITGDGIKGGGSNYVTVSGNHFTNFSTQPGDHPDAIQFWTVNTTTTTHDLVITDNVYVRGTGDAVQGIFLGNELDIPYQNVTISGNVISGGMYQGISVYEADNAQVSNNYVQAYADGGSFMQMEGTTHSSFTNNVTTSSILDNNNNVGLVTSNNTTVAAASVGNDSGGAQWLQDQGETQGAAPPVTTPPTTGTGGDSSTPEQGPSTGTSSGSSGAHGVGESSSSVGQTTVQADPDQTLVGTPGGGILTGGSGNDSILGGDGVNYLRGGQGDDHMTGGANFDDMNGNEGNDTLSGGLGSDWVVGGKDNDNLSGDDGDDIVYGNLGGDTCDGGAGADIVRGGQGDDVITGGVGNDWLSGDRGSDTLTGGAGADTFHSFSGAGVDLVTDFHAVEGDRVQLDPGTHFTLSQVGADTHIDMGNGDEVILQGVQLSTLPDGWLFAA
jgi:parallel beta-helix repeat protein